MTQSMITAARLIGHKSINGRYQSLMQMDQMEALGHQMTHSLDSFITDSANSATALYTGRKSSVNALNVYADSVSCRWCLLSCSGADPHTVRHALRRPEARDDCGDVQAGDERRARDRVDGSHRGCDAWWVSGIALPVQLFADNR